MEKKNKVEISILPDFKLHCEATIIKTRWRWPKWTENRYTDRRNRIVSRNRPPSIYGQLILNTIPREFNGERKDFPEIVLEQLETCVGKNEHQSLPHTMPPNPRHIKHLNAKTKTIKPLEANRRIFSTLEETNISWRDLNRHSRWKIKIDKFSKKLRKATA